MCPSAISSASGLLALLSENSDDLKRHALINIDKVVHEYWYQISGSIASVEALYEDDEFSHRELAALVASKVNPRPCILNWLFATATCRLLAREPPDVHSRSLCLVTQVFYHLGELDDALSYALGAGSLFNVNDESEYVQTLVCK